MAVLGRVLFSSGERVDLPDLVSMDSYNAGDWRYFLQSVVGTSKPYILSGFDVISPETAIGVPSCSIRVADSVVYYPGSSAGPFFYGLPEGNSASAPLVPQLRINAVNYVYLTLSTINVASDTRALWDPDRNNGAGQEFSQDINTESALTVQVQVSTGSFPANTVPVAIITTGPTSIQSIQDARDMLFRLGTGGLNPNPLNVSAISQIEPATMISQVSDANPFRGGDKDLSTLKEWMDVVMTKLKKLGGTRYWYEEADAFGLVTLFQDILVTSWKSKGKYSHSDSTPGEITWSEDIWIKRVNSPKEIVIRAATSSNSINLANEQVAFIELIRGSPINTLDAPVAFTNGQAYINTVGGSVGLFQNLKKGDWIKKASDPDAKLLQVREFYNTTQTPGPISGSTTTAANARSIILSGPYTGDTSQPVGDRATFDRGEYIVPDIQIVDRSDPALMDAGGNVLWIALRSDTVQNLSSISTHTVSGSVSSTDSAGVTISAAAHGLVDGDYITVTAPAAQAGTYTVNVVDTDTFTFKSGVTAAGAFTGYYGIGQTTGTTVNGFQLESSFHGLTSGAKVSVSGTTSFNGTYQVNVRSNTSFQFPIGASAATEATGTVTLARVAVRGDQTIGKLIQGETVDIGSMSTDNVRSFMGMSSPNQNYPVYSLPSGYPTFNSGANYNSAISDSLAARVSQNTAMLMNKAQDKNIRYLTEATSATNVDGGGGLRNLYFTPASNLTVLQPGSPGNAVVTLPTSAAPIQLAVNQCAYVTINRNAATTPAITVTSTASMPVGENVFVVASRLGGNEVFLWNNQAILNEVVLRGASSAATTSSNGLVTLNAAPVSSTNPVVSVTDAAGKVIATGLTSGSAPGPTDLAIGNGANDGSVLLGKATTSTIAKGQLVGEKGVTVPSTMDFLYGDTGVVQQIHSYSTEWVIDSNLTRGVGTGNAYVQNVGASPGKFVARIFVPRGATITGMEVLIYNSTAGAITFAGHATQFTYTPSGYTDTPFEESTLMPMSQVASTESWVTFPLQNKAIVVESDGLITCALDTPSGLAAGGFRVTAIRTTYTMTAFRPFA